MENLERIKRNNVYLYFSKFKDMKMYYDSRDQLDGQVVYSSIDLFFYFILSFIDLDILLNRKGKNVNYLNINFIL